ncbi:hypothetical protein AB0H88_41140 [Nonomuraea sp. NPDC050680]
MSRPSRAVVTRGVVQSASAQVITDRAPFLELSRAATGRSSAPTATAGLR